MEVDLNKWFHCKVDKEEFVKLLQRSDYQGFKHMFIFFGSLIFFGYLAYLTWGTWWTVLFFFYLWKYLELCRSYLARDRT